MQSDKDRDNKENRKKRLLDDYKVTRNLFELCGRSFSKMEKIKDPMLKFSVFVTSLDIMFDFGINMADIMISDRLSELEESDRSGLSHIETELKLSICDIRSQIEKFFDEMREYLAMPTYNPDMPLGKKMMNESNSDFDKLKQKP